jgi:hypothetical protein
MVQSYNHRRFLGLLVLSAILLGVFSLYASSLRFPSLYDESYDLIHIADRTIFSLFDFKPYGTLNYRPVRLIPWIIVRDLFGWFRSDMLHFASLSVHVLNTALLAALAYRLSRVWRLPGYGFAALSAIIFGVFPFSYQAVIWAGALSHPMMTLCGLAGVHAYIKARMTCRKLGSIGYTLLSAIFLLGACLSHEQGFTFAFWVLFLEVLFSWRAHQKPRVHALILSGLMFLYIAFFKLFLQANWTDPRTLPLTDGIPELLSKTAYMAQGIITWLLVLSRYLFGLPEQKYLIIFGLTLLASIAYLMVLWRYRRLSLGLLCLGWWGVAAAPPILFLYAG